MIYPLVIDDNESNTVILPSSLKAEGRTAVAFGSFLAPCTIISSSGPSDSIIVAGDVAQRLLIPFAAKVHVFLTDEAVHIGPLVGVFTAGFTKSPHRPVGGRSFFFAKLLAQEKQVGGFAFLFGLPHIDWEHGTVNGYFYTERCWERHTVPLPTVIYNRLPNRRIENDDMFQTVTKTLQTAYGIPVFNGRFFNKWEVYRRLAVHRDARPYLPETSAYVTRQTIEQFLNRYTGAYVKPADGSLGRGIYHLVKKRMHTNAAFVTNTAKRKQRCFRPPWRYGIICSPTPRFIVTSFSKPSRSSPSTDGRQISASIRTKMKTANGK